MTGSTARPSCTSSQSGNRAGGREPRLLPRHLADRHHLVDRRHVAERQHGLELRVAADLAASTGTLAPVPAARATFFGNTAGSPRNARRDATNQAFGASRSCAQYQSTVGGRPCASGTAARSRASRACAMSGQRRSVPPAGAGRVRQLDLAAGMGGDRAARRRRSRSPRWCRRDRCRDARPCRASP